ncbi:MAG TPA: transporter substrate-binding domain-containing protein [Dehalococcoidia bacterium]|nr:transporter substrate-binding domain-containing protein [Dehalococcoidia bacterium]
MGTRIAPPFVMKTDEGELTGFSIDLWRAIAAELKLRSRFEVHDTLPGLLDAVRTGKNPVGISAVSITAERATTLDFSQPMYRSGLGIMVRTADEHIDILGLLFSKAMLLVLGGLVLLILIPAHIFWWIARTQDEDLPIRRPYIPGIFDAILWCSEALGGAHKEHPRQHIPRILAMIWLYIGILLISSFTAYIATSLTHAMLRGHITGPHDLPGKRVAVVQGSTGAEYAAEMKARLKTCADLSACVAVLLDRSADAVVYDAPMIQHTALKNPRVEMVGQPFHPENYGIIFPLGSPQRRPVDEALLKLQETGTYDKLLKKWMGRSSKH